MGIDTSSYFSDMEEPSQSNSPLQTSSETIAIDSIGDEQNSSSNSALDSDQLFFTTVDSDHVKANKKKPVNPKYKKSFLNNIFNSDK